MVKRVKLKFPRHEIPGLVERPGWWQVRPEEIIKVVKCVKKGHAEQIAETPGGFPVWSVAYGPPRAKPGTATWASSSASGNVATYKTDEAGPQVVILGCCIHGAESESAAGAVNLITLLETGQDLRGRERPGLVELIAGYRFIIIPCINMDGRAVSPDHLRGASEEEFRRSNQGSWLDGRLIGYPGCKEWAPLPLDRVAHPGGYPNGDGFNIQHDANPGQLQTKEAAGILKLVAEEQADLFLNMHSHGIGGQLLGASLLAYPLHVERVHAYKQRVFDALQAGGLRPAPAHPMIQRCALNIDACCGMASGALAATFEQASTADWTFEEALETFYVTVETFLDWGRKERFSPRLPTAYGQTEG